MLKSPFLIICAVLLFVQFTDVSCRRLRLRRPRVDRRDDDASTPINGQIRAEQQMYEKRGFADLFDKVKEPLIDKVVSYGTDVSENLMNKVVDQIGNEGLIFF
ncbi:uncharacterized protein LOC142341414 [Convolutriloba macropyga]|uniref:uncharacterized protein LOC142341414 n=1 Tax=Convolutriloba macropyga TaxID=536237 RepID=UPI003F51F269